MDRLTRLSLASKAFIGLAIIYSLLAFTLPVDTVSRAHLRITDLEYTFILLAIRLPIIAVWCLTFYAYRQLNAYSKSVNDTVDGKHFKPVTYGVAWIAWGLPVVGVVAAVLNSIAYVHMDFRPISLIITNYGYVLITLFAFSFISAGVHRLSRQSNILFTTRHLRWFVFSLVLLGVLFCYLISSRLHGSNVQDSYNAYYMPNLLVWVSIVVPYLYAWFLGIFAALELVLVSRSTSGIIYKRALQYVALGLVLVIVGMCFLQYFRAVVPRTGRLTLGATLGFTYLIYVFTAIGSVLLAKGAKKLKRIEDI